MKLRFRKNSLRLRVNQIEAQMLADGQRLEERLDFPGHTGLGYVLACTPDAQPQVTFVDGVISISVPSPNVRSWATADAIGMYFELSTAGLPLNIAVEKDLECLDAPIEERDPHAYPRTSAC